MLRALSALAAALEKFCGVVCAVFGLLAWSRWQKRLTKRTVGSFNTQPYGLGSQTCTASIYICLLGNKSIA